MISVVRTGCSQYTIQTGNSNQSYEITIANINGGFSQSYAITDNANAVISFSIDGIYTFTQTGSPDFGNCTDLVPTGGGTGTDFLQYVIPAQFVAPQYAGYIISIKVTTSLATYNFQYTIQNTDTSRIGIMANIAAYVNGLSLAGVTALSSDGNIIINFPDDITSFTSGICLASYTQYLWSTCALFKCIQHLTNKIFCCKRKKCEEHTKEMQKERNEMNRIMMLYSQLSMMNDDERWDYMPLTLNTSIGNDIFDKLNIITARCGHCCKDFRWKRKHHHKRQENNECGECNPQNVTDWCQKLPVESVSVTGPNVTEL